MTETTLRPSVARPRTYGAAPAAAIVAAAGFLVEGGISLFHHTGDDHWDALSQVMNGAYAVAALALIVALSAVGLWLRVSRAGRVGVLLAQIGYAAMAVESVVSAFNDGNTLGWLFFGGLLLSLVGLLGLGIAAMVAGHRRWAALLPFLGMLVGTIGGEHGGSIVTAAVWVLLGVALLQPEADSRAHG